MTSSPIQHGGNQYGIRRRLGLGDRPLLDFSVSLNPLGPPPAALAAARKAIDRSGESRAGLSEAHRQDRRQA